MVPTPEDLLDIHWLTQVQASQGFACLLNYLRRGAETYGGAITAIAEALSAPPRLGRWADTIDLRNALAHKLLSGSWSVDPDGPLAHARLQRPLCGVWMLPPEMRQQRVKESGTAPCEVPLPDFRTLRLIEPLDCAWVAHTEGIWSCDVTPDGNYMLSSSRDGDIAVWDMARGTLVARVSTGEREIRDCAVSPNGREVISVHASGRVSIWDFPTLHCEITVDAPSARPCSDEAQALYDYVLRASPRRWRKFALSPDGTLLAVAGWSEIHVWNLGRRERLNVLPVHVTSPPGILTLFFRSDQLLTVIGRDTLPRVVTWDLPSQQIVRSEHGPDFNAPWISRAIIAPNAGCLLGISGSETTVLGPTDEVTTVRRGAFGQAVAVSRDGRMAATCGRGTEEESSEYIVRLWSLPDLREVWQCNLRELGCRDIACALAFTPEGRSLIVAGWEGVLRRLVLPTGFPLEAPSTDRGERNA